MPNAGDARNEPGAPAEEAKADVDQKPEITAGEIKTIEAETGVGELSKLSAIEKPKLSANDEPKDPNWTWDRDKEKAEEFADDDDLFDTSAYLPIELEAQRDEWKTVPFGMGEIATYTHAGETYVSISRICKDLQLEKANQLKKLKAGNYRCGLITTPDRRNVLQPHFCLNAKDLFRWLDGIAAGRIAAETALKLASYKAALMDVLVDHEVQTRVQEQTPAVISPETQALLEAARQSFQNSRHQPDATGRCAVLKTSSPECPLPSLKYAL